jgi:DnaJ family protein C protein 13
VPEDGGIIGDRASLIDAATALIHLTCLASPRNAFELIEEHGVEKLLHLLAQLVGLSGVNARTEPKHVQLSILGNVLHTLSGLATLPEARARYKALPNFPSHLALCTSFIQSPKVMQHSLVVRASPHSPSTDPGLPFTCEGLFVLV